MPPARENQKEKTMEHDMDSEGYTGLIRKEPKRNRPVLHHFRHLRLRVYDQGGL